MLAACVLLAAALILFSLGRPAQAAVALQNFTALANGNGVLLTWDTNGEQNVQSFDVFCKLAGEPQSAYHPITSVPAKGGLGQLASYVHFVNASTLTPGQSYCFMVQEITTEPGVPGERREACGFGINITPTATPTQTAVLLDVTATPLFQNISPLASPTPTPFGYVDPAASGVFATATALAAQATLVGTTGVAGATPTLDPNAVYDPFAHGLTPTPDPFSNLATPTITPVLDPAALTATMDPFNSQLQTPLPSETPTGELSASLDGGAGDAMVAAQAAEPTPTSLYIAVTAEPTPAAVALLPLPSPWPTATPIPAPALVGWLAPTAQNLTVMLLCFIFISASGLGALGLITSVMYIRSQSRRRDLEDLRRRSRTRL